MSKIYKVCENGVEWKCLSRASCFHNSHLKECIKIVVLQSEEPSWSKLILEDGMCSFPSGPHQEDVDVNSEICGFHLMKTPQTWKFQDKTIILCGVLCSVRVKTGRLNSVVDLRVGIRLWVCGLKSNYSYRASTLQPFHVSFRLAAVAMHFETWQQARVRAAVAYLAAAHMAGVRW